MGGWWNNLEKEVGHSPDFKNSTGERDQHCLCVDSDVLLTEAGTQFIFM